MTAYTYKEFTVPPGTEQDTWSGPNSKSDISPNFNGQNSTPYNGNFIITSINEVPQGMLFTALYGIAGANTITVQFTAPLQTASSTTSDYTLVGPSAPSISSVSWSTGSRSVLLNLSGPLNSANTYTLAIGNNKILSGSQISYLTPKGGTWNWPGLTVDVIQPTEIDIVGTGIQQDIVFGTPVVDNLGLFTSVGIQQDIVIGTPDAATIIAEFGVGVQQDISIGVPNVGLFDVITGVGFAQTISVGTPAASQQQQPLGVGFVQTIVIGTPIADVNPLTVVGIGVNNTINIGIPTITGPANVDGVGIAEFISLGVPTMSQPTSFFNGIGIPQDIVVGIPLMAQAATMNPVAFDEVIDIGVPTSSTFVAESGIGIIQDISVGTPFIMPTDTHINAGIRQDILFGIPNLHQVGSALQLSHRQATTIISLDAALQLAFSEGVSGTDPNLIDPIGVINHDYRDTFTILQQHQTKAIFEDVAAAAMVALNIPGVLPTTNSGDITPIAKETNTGTSGSLTFVDGMLVSKTDPS